MKILESENARVVITYRGKLVLLSKYLCFRLTGSSEFLRVLRCNSWIS